jgi:hypothetical protein
MTAVNGIAQLRIRRVQFQGRLMRTLALLLGIAMLAPPPAAAQAFRTRVVDARNGNPIAGAVALIRFQSGNNVGVLGEAVTDADGWLAFNGGGTRHLPRAAR